MTASSQSAPRLLRLKTVIARTGWCKSSIYQAIKRSEFPPPIKLGARASAWVESEIEQYIESRVRASRAA